MYSLIGFDNSEFAISFDSCYNTVIDLEAAFLSAGCVSGFVYNDSGMIGIWTIRKGFTPFS